MAIHSNMSKPFLLQWKKQNIEPEIKNVELCDWWPIFLSVRFEWCFAWKQMQFSINWLWTMQQNFFFPFLPATLHACFRERNILQSRNAKIFYDVRIITAFCFRSTFTINVAVFNQCPLPHLMITQAYTRKKKLSMKNEAQESNYFHITWWTAGEQMIAWFETIFLPLPLQQHHLFNSHHHHIFLAVAITYFFTIISKQYTFWHKYYKNQARFFNER